MPVAVSRFTALTTPCVTVCSRPNGLPIAIAVSPTATASESPSVTAGRRRQVATLSKARSLARYRCRPRLRCGLARAELDIDRCCALDDMIIGQDQAAVIDHKARAGTGRGSAAAPAADLALVVISTTELPTSLSTAPATLALVVVSCATGCAWITVCADAVLGTSQCAARDRADRAAAHGTTGERQRQQRRRAGAPPAPWRRCLRAPRRMVVFVSLGRY